MRFRGHFVNWTARSILPTTSRPDTRAGSSLALLAAKEDVEYATGRYRREAGTAEVVVITTSKFLRAEVSGIESGEPQVSATAWPRAAVTAVSVSAEEGVNSDRRYSEWPGRIDVAFSVGDVRIAVPLDRAYSFQESEMLQRILAVELERLVTPRADALYGQRAAQHGAQADLRPAPAAQELVASPRSAKGEVSVEGDAPEA